MISELLFLAGNYVSQEERISVSIESYIIAFVYQYCEFKLKVQFIHSENSKYPCTVPSSIFKSLNCNFDKENLCQEPYCVLPSIVTDEGKTVVAGLCGALRWAIKDHLAIYPEHHCIDLLGFRGGCLVACTESSIWTRFCELQLPGSVQEVSSKIKNGCFLQEIPKNLVLLDEHLKRPVRTHNILKRKLDIAKKIKQNSVQNGAAHLSNLKSNFTLYDRNSSPVDENSVQQKLQNMVITEKSEDFALDHCYLEGIDFSLADMIVFPCVCYLLNKLPAQALKHLTHVVKWYETMCANGDVKKAAEVCGLLSSNPLKECVIDDNIKIIVPVVDQISLYKRDPSHTKVKCKYRDPGGIISFLQTADIHPKYVTSYCTTLEWKTLPSMLHPSQGDLPEKRLDRKCQQIESIVTAVLKIAKDNQTIVEFCAGGGHVGLLLAYFLPGCKVLLIENKESSIMRAKSRAENLKLTNVHFYQCNLDYFKGVFDIGVSLHACGVATDLVIQQCTNQKASFVCCPCCYGSVQDTHLLSYPLSKRFQKTNISKREYTLLAHFADRSEVNTPTAEQGEVCMGFIDTDRLHFAVEQGYKAHLTTLNPITCSPKHNLLIGISPLQM